MAKIIRSSAKTAKSARSKSTRSDHKPPPPIRRKPARATKTSTSARRSSTQKSSPGPSWAWRNLSSERKLDILGIGLALLGLFTTLSLLSSQRGLLTQLWVDFLLQIAGWGAYILPATLVLIGLWLALRGIERLPNLSPERLAGFILLYLNFLAWIHLLSGAGWPLSPGKLGGGYLGGLPTRLLVSGFGIAGAVVALAAWLLIGLTMTFDLSIPEIFSWLQSLLKNTRQTVRSAPPKTSQRPNHPLEDREEEVNLPSDFRPFSPINQAGTETARKTRQPAKPDKDIKAPPVIPQPNAPAENSPPSIWVLPTMDKVLDPATPQAIQTSSDHDRARIIEDTLKSFGAPTHVVEIHRGPTVTQFGVEPDFIEGRSGRTRVRVSKIVGLADDLALALAASRIRIQAPVPGRSYVGIEVPNEEISRVTLREVIEGDSFKRLRSPLRLALGKNVSGVGVAIDLSNMPHLLIAGTTGSGKSVCVNSILCAFLLNNSPADLRLVLVDPKRVELTNYNGIPHLLAPVVVDADRVIGALQWMMREMDSRYHKFSQNGSRNIHEYNTRHPEDRLPYLVVVIDELADLMMLAPDETERSIARLAQLARATGIHLILATQRPSVDVVTGLIKANFPARIAFAVASQIDSRVILDQPGAERLLGRGDMLFQSPDAAAPVRLQGVFVSDSEIQRLVDYWRTAALTAAEPQYQNAAIETFPPGAPLHQAPLWEDTEEAGDPLLKEAIDLVRREDRASITMLQRHYRIGYTRAARLIDMMEEKQIISPAMPNSQAREVLDYGPTAPPPED
ncbi:MAG: DNA translocase FtsK [Anaerolineaceae bacterium]|nr:DNA translocase FtsK [Anaerolineaceae bacterium]